MQQNNDFTSASEDVVISIGGFNERNYRFESDQRQGER